ncbi:MAG: GtrA family protein [Coriobacteriales bacterium]|nr:GtrA family protein [Coriobacteriales bacterium]
MSQQTGERQSARGAAMRPARDTTARQGGRYLLVGFSSAAIELVSFALLHEGLSVATLFANPVALTLSTLFNFILSRTWTFRSVSSLPRSVVLYLLLFCFNQVFSTGMVIFLESVGVYSLIAKMITMGCVVLWNFFLYRKVIFK